MKKEFEPYMSVSEMRHNTFLLDLYHLDINDFEKLDTFKSNYNVKVSLIDIAGLWGDYMLHVLDCTSCGVDATYFNLFYEWLIEEESKYNK